MDLKNKVIEINNLIGLNNFPQALLKCESLIKKLPNNSYLLNLYGLILQQLGQVEKSIIYFQKSLSFQENNYPAMNNMANSYKNLFKFEKAENLYKKIINDDPKNIKALNNYANLKKELNQFKNAKELFLKALKIEPNNLNILLNLSSSCQSLGEISEAKKYALKILNINPTHTSAHKILSTLINYSEDSGNLDEMKKLTNNEVFEKFSFTQKAEIFFALSKAYEDKNNYEKSFNFLNKGNSLIEKNYNKTLNNVEKLFDNIIKLFETIDIKYPKKLEDKKNIFICGMPRSGTTLAEQIIASHKNVSGAGEIHYLSNIINNSLLSNLKFNKSIILDELGKSNNLVFERYNDYLNFHNFGSKIITDKAPQNFIWIGFIKIFFPNSKIIHCFRNPKDNCFSIYKNMFFSNTMFWSYDQEKIAHYYLLYLKLMDYWKSKFKDQIYDLEYEKIVTSPEKEIKKIISFCELEWDPECLNFHKNKKTPVQTISVSQANRPIYQSSLNSSKFYSDHLSKMFKIIDGKT